MGEEAVDSSFNCLKDRVHEIRTRWENPDFTHDMFIHRNFLDLFDFIDILRFKLNEIETKYEEFKKEV